jgi:uncharacterized protein (TIGR00369 family)
VLLVQPFQVLHGGVSALVAEGLASMGAHMASGFRRVAGVSLSINHFRSAKLGDVVRVRAAPIHVGRSTQVRTVIISPSGRRRHHTTATTYHSNTFVLFLLINYLFIYF